MFRREDEFMLLLGPAMSCGLEPLLMLRYPFAGGRDMVQMGY